MTQPKEWHVGGKNNCIIYDQDGMPIANANVYYSIVGGIEAMQANAQLIAQTPKLLAALKRAIPWLGKLIASGIHKECVAPNDVIGALQQAEAAVAEATRRKIDISPIVRALEDIKESVREA